MQIISEGEVSHAHKPDILAWFLYNCRKRWGLFIFVSHQWCVHYPSFISQHCCSHRFHHHHWRHFHTEVAGRRHPRLPFLKNDITHWRWSSRDVVSPHRWAKPNEDERFKKQRWRKVKRRVDGEAWWRSLISAAQTADDAEPPISQHFSSDDFSILQIWPENVTWWKCKME